MTDLKSIRYKRQPHAQSFGQSTRFGLWPPFLAGARLGAKRASQTIRSILYSPRIDMQTIRSGSGLASAMQVRSCSTRKRNLAETNLLQIAPAQRATLRGESLLLLPVTEQRLPPNDRGFDWLAKLARTPERRSILCRLSRFGISPMAGQHSPLAHTCAASPCKEEGAGPP